MTNRLAASTSPYLQQHAENPVDWYAWGDDAFAEARRRDVPVLISIGYAACHWCHVMAHESFEDPATADAVNSRFVAIKVDREERPDVDAVYMAATLASTGQGGWPMTVFATPEGEPFWCGTYFPPVPVGGYPSFREVLDAVASAWADRRGDVQRTAATLREALSDENLAGPVTLLAPDEIEDAAVCALDTLARTFDSDRGGFGGAPKFPPTTTLEWLLRRHARTGDVRALAMAERTLEAMARGGIVDQLGGGFARYAVDATWTVPHFEKMLDDNAQLLRVYVHWWRATRSALALRVVEDTATWLLREMRTPQGAFAASLDADTDGVEGATYAWTPAQLTDALGPDDAEWARLTFVVTVSGTFEHGASVLQLPAEPGDPRRFARVRERLLAARSRRSQPARDDKVVAAWNGLAVGALAEAGALLGRDAWVEAAARAAELLWDVHLHGPGTRLVRTSRDGVAGSSPAVLADYSTVADGFMALYSATGDDRWAGRAGSLLDTVLGHFRDREGRFWDTADDETDPVLACLQRPSELADGPAPSGQAAAAGALLTSAALTGSVHHRRGAEQALVGPLGLAARHPRAAGWALAVGEALLDGPREIAVVGPPDHPGTIELVAAARQSLAPGAVLAHGDPTTAAHGAVPLLRDRPLRDGLPAAYVCRGLVCGLPVTEPDELARALTSHSSPTAS